MDIKDSRDKQIRDKSDYVHFVSLKAEKLASALHILTNFLAEREPLRCQLRDRSLLVLEAIKYNDQAARLIDDLAVLIQVAISGQLVSEMNFSILRQEYLKLKETISIPDLSFRDSEDKGQRPVLVKPLRRSLPAPTSASNHSRRDKIIRLIKEKGQSSIKDIARLIPDFSSKTVQRELSALVQAGVVKKEGERRWSRYALVDAD